VREWERKTYEDLVRVVKKDAYALVECLDTRTNKKYKVLCGVFLDGEEPTAFPLAILITTQQDLKALKFIRRLDDVSDS
jgi:hypothetical protein